MVTFSDLEGDSFSNPLPVLKSLYNAAYPSFPPTQRVASYVAPFVKGAVKSYLPGPLGSFAANLVPYSGSFRDQLATRSYVRSLAKPVSNYLANVASNSLRTYSRSSKMVRYMRRARGRRPLSFRRARREGRSRTYRSNRATLPTPFPRAEIKLSGGNVTGVSVATASGYIIPVSGVARGTGTADREGNVIKSVSLELKGAFLPFSNTVCYTNVRIILCKWNQGYVSPSVTSILQTTGGLLLHAAYNQADARNYKILYDRVHQSRSVSAGSAAVFTPIAKTFWIRKRLADIVTYNGGAQGDYDSAYFAIFVCDNSCTMDMSNCFRFIDI